MVSEKKKEYNRMWRKSAKAKAYDADYNKSEQFKAYHKKWREENKEKRGLANMEYRKSGKVNEYEKARRAKDPAYKLICNLRTRHRQVLHGASSTTKGLGCDSTFLRDYLSAQWTEGMNWDNHGYGKDKWNIDHIVPLSLYHTNPELLPKLIHYTNMQPMWQPENQKKSNKVA